MQISHKLQQNRIDAYRQLEQKNPFQGVMWAGILGNEESNFFERLMAETIEENSGYQLTRRSISLRDLVSELSILSNDIVYIQKVLSEFEDKSLLSHFSYLKFQVEDIFETWGGAREFPRLICLGGVRKDLKLGDQKSLSQSLDSIETEYLAVLEYCLLDFFIEENLREMDHSVGKKLRSHYQFWPELVGDFSLESVANAMGEKKHFVEKWRSLAKLKNEPMSLYQIFCSRLLRIHNCIQGIRKSLEVLPDGDHRVIVDHLHIPGSFFVSNDLKSSSGRIYSYYCSGKIRFSSFSTHMLSYQHEKQGINKLSSKFLNVLGVDLVQGALCEKMD